MLLFLVHVSIKQKSRKEYFLRKRVRTSGKRLTRMNDGTLQKVGDFLQSTPSIIHSKGWCRISKIYSMFCRHCRMACFCCRLLMYMFLESLSALLSCSLIYEINAFIHLFWDSLVLEWKSASIQRKLTPPCVSVSTKVRSVV